MISTFEAKAVEYPNGEYSARVYEYCDGILAAEVWLGRYDTEEAALDCARQRIADMWLFMVQTDDATD